MYSAPSLRTAGSGVLIPVGVSLLFKGYRGFVLSIKDSVYEVNMSPQFSAEVENV